MSRSPRSALALVLVTALTGCAPEEEMMVAPAADIDRVDVEDFASDDGFTASVWVQGNSAFAEGAVACWEDSCATVDDTGFAHVGGLPAGEVAIKVDGGGGVPLLLPLTLNNHWSPHLAARSLTAGIYPSWMEADAWPSGTGLIDIYTDNANADGLVPGIRLSTREGEIWTVHDLSYAVQDDVSTGTGPLWVAGVPPGTVTFNLTFDGGLCSARSMGWSVAAEGNTITMTVPTGADRVTSVYVQCVALP